jgi:ATP-dependent DNA helicase PIF1
MAACNIGGTTIHSFSGIGLGTEPIEQLISKVKKQRLAAGRWQRAKVLVIDEST